MNKLISSVVLATALILSIFANAAENNSKLFRNTNMKMLAKASKYEKKPMMVFVGGRYCGMSQKMNDVFMRTDVSGFMNEHFVCKNMDASNIFNQLKAANWGVIAVPSYVFLDSKGKVIYLASGYKKPEKMMEEATAALDKLRDQNNRYGY